MFVPLFFAFSPFGHGHHFSWSDFSRFTSRADTVDWSSNSSDSTDADGDATTSEQTVDATDESTVSDTSTAAPSAPVASDTPMVSSTSDPVLTGGSMTPPTLVSVVPLIDTVMSTTLPDATGSEPTDAGASSTIITSIPMDENAATSAESVEATDTSPATPAPVPTETKDLFSTGGVTFRFDDGWVSQFDTALPILDAAGIKGTFYIVTRQLADDGYSGFVSSAQVQEMAARGEDIGAHTETHPHLPTLSTSGQQKEIEGSRADLIALGITPQTLSYPYGEYTSTDVALAKDAGFAGAVTTIESLVSPSSDPYQLESPSIVVTQSPEDIENMIESAIRNHEWLIMTFHRIDESGDQYSITPANFQAIVEYVQSHSVPTVTVSEGLRSLAR